MQFQLESFLNPHLPPGGQRADIVFSLTASGKAAPALKLVGLIADKSGSMSGEKMEQLKQALHVAIDQMDDSVEAFILAFNSKTERVLPTTRMDAPGRTAAHYAIERLEAGGRTAMSGALRAARAEFLRRPGALAQAILLTDGQNDQQDQVPLEDALRESAGVFQADCRGVGTDWSPAQLRNIAGHLLGTAQLVATPEALAEDFRATLAAALSKSVAEVCLRLWMPKNARLLTVKQAFPVEIDLTARLRPVDQRAVDIPLGAWGEGSQDYFASFGLTPLGLGEEMLVCRPSIVWRDGSGQPVSTPGQPVLVNWTDAAELSTRIDGHVAHYTGQAEKARAIQEGLEALERSDEANATRQLGRALDLAEAAGDAETTRRLAAVIARDAGGTLRLRRDAPKLAVMDLDVGSTRTLRAKRE